MLANNVMCYRSAAAQFTVAAICWNDSLSPSPSCRSNVDFPGAAVRRHSLAGEPEVQRLRRAHELDRYDGLRVGHDLAVLPHAYAAHADVVLLVSAHADVVHNG